MSYDPDLFAESVHQRGEGWRSRCYAAIITGLIFLCSTGFAFTMMTEYSFGSFAGCGLPLVFVVGAILSMQLLDLYLYSPGSLRRIERRARRRMDLLYGSDWELTTTSAQFRRERQRGISRLMRRAQFATHLFGFLAFYGFILMVMYVNWDGQIPSEALRVLGNIAGLWAIALGLHGLFALPELPNRDRAVLRETKRKLDRPQHEREPEKPKRAYLLSDDGELIPLENDGAADETVPKRQRR
ncbi:MAG: hypothetical protein SNJ59_08745 [Aggregatilineales bacterium]